MSRNVNLLNPALRPARAWLSGSRMMLLWLLSLGLVVAASAWVAVRRDAALAEQRSLAQREEQATAEVKRISEELATRKGSPELIAALEQRRALLRTRTEVLEMLQGGALGDTTGHARYLRAFARQHREGLWLTGLTVTGAGDDIVLRGRTLEPEMVPAYLKRLGGEVSLRGHPFNRLQMARPEPPEVVQGRPPAQPEPWIEFLVATRAVAGPNATADEKFDPKPDAAPKGSYPAGSPQ